MTWTQEDYDNVKQAYLDLMLGKRVVEIEAAGKQRVFQRADAADLKALMEEMVASLGTSTVTLRTYAKQGGRGA